MFFKRGIMMGVLLSIISLQNLVKAFNVFYLLALILGIVQIVASVNYTNGYKKCVLLCCFIIEGLYYIGSLVYLFTSDATYEVLAFGTIIALVFIVIIGMALYKLFLKIADREEKLC